ncbi:MAG: zinc ribbon domain-containing protein [Methanobrevibacter sp.]|uniref:zinc-ribbon domain-containing protein n=1 Tax=Methanobrevibacter sp. TaxID=66852 RepID=UPI0026DF75F1|nr:zinc-ribbon domain-containing protein [Methanobrevibacter sp.]MDO5848418.1 zinc ribbon domain-containing protein [Methanobrevibacter sp.]
MVKCSNCGTEGMGKFCSQCGTKLVHKEAPTVETKIENGSDGMVKFNKCSSCGSSVDSSAKFCDMCGADLDENKEVIVVEKVNPIKSAIFSAIVPGIGQVYNNQPKKGLIIFVIWIIGVILILFIVGWIIVVIMWLYSIYDAFTSAKKLNEGILLDDSIL